VGEAAVVGQVEREERERVLDLVDGAAMIDGRPSAADAAHAATLDLDIRQLLGIGGRWPLAMRAIVIRALEVIDELLPDEGPASGIR
jgi:hypothetical protein